MTIAVPIAGQAISVATFGQPVVDAVNELVTDVAALEAAQTAWGAWVPTLTNITQGSGGVVTAFYKQVGKIVYYRFSFTLGTGSAIAANPRISLPVTPLASGYPAGANVGHVGFGDTGTADRIGTMRIISGSTAEFISYSTTGVATITNATTPHTWATTDVLQCYGFYEAA